MTKNTTSYRNVRKSYFTQISNDLLNDKTLTLESKGLLSIFLSNNDDWNLHMSEIIERSKNGRDAHYTALKKLIKAGYIARLEYKGISNKKFIKLEYIFSDNKDDIKQGIKEAQNIANQNEQFIILTYKEIESKKIEEPLEKKPYPENQETEDEFLKIPFTENPDTAFPDSEKPYPENQYINNTKNNNTNKNNNNINNRMNGMNEVTISNTFKEDHIKKHTSDSFNQTNNLLIDEQLHLLKYIPENLQQFIKSRYTLNDSIKIINKIMQAKKTVGDKRNDNLFFFFEHNEELSEVIIEILISVNREMKKKNKSINSMLGYYYNSLVNGLEEFHFTSEAREVTKNNY